MQNEIDLEKIADEQAKTVVEAISVANEMKLINDQQDLQALIKAGISQALQDVLVQLEQKGSL